MAIETYTQPPRTIMEVFNSLPEGTHVQLIENALVMGPSPWDCHARVKGDIGTDLHFLAKQNYLGVARFAPYDVYLDEENIFQPDICFIANEHLDRIKRNGLHGAPDLVIEILSPGTAQYDLNEKKAVYKRCGVTEYWIINPEDRSSTGYYLTGNEYEEFFREKECLK